VPPRIAVYTDYAYQRAGGQIYGKRAFTLFLSRLARELNGLTLVGRVDPSPATPRYALAGEIDFVELPFYPSLSHPASATAGMLRSLRHFWRALAGVDAVWILGPHPLALPFAGLAALRGKRVMLGVRQDFPSYIRNRRPSAVFRAAAWFLERSFRALSRVCATVAVGPELARNYDHAKRLLAISVSLVDEPGIVSLETATGRPYQGELQVLSVGRLDAEKNPLMLAEVLENLRRQDPRWRLVVCGEGDLENDLAGRIAAAGMSEFAELRGYVPLDGGLLDLYRDSHALLHVSWTEGLPQVLFEAFAAGLPVVATDVGGIAEAVGDAVTLIPPGDPGRAADALRQVAADAARREELIERELQIAHSHTMEAEVERVAAFLAED
jgi:glycosyltransferase involved in cell wall biosynthesis